MSFKGTILVLCLFILGAAFSGFAAYSEKVIHPKHAEAIDAKKLASQNCASCHGQDLTGKIGPNLHKKGAVLSAATIAQVIKDGAGNMPSDPGKMNDKEIAAVAQYITTLGDDQK